MKSAKDFRMEALQCLQGKWGEAVLVGILASVLSGSSQSVVVNANINLPAEEIAYYFGEAAMWIIAGIVICGLAVTIVIGGAVMLGRSVFFLNLADGNKTEIGQLFSQFHRIGTGICMQLLTGIFIFLWTLLLFIPGVVAIYSYSMTPYILAEHPEYTARQAISLSKQMMRGNRWRLFCLQLSFIGWSLLSLLTCGIGLLWVNAYTGAAEARFYREISGTPEIPA